MNQTTTLPYESPADHARYNVTSPYTDEASVIFASAYKDAKGTAGPQLRAIRDEAYRKVSELPNGGARI